MSVSPPLRAEEYQPRYRSPHADDVGIALVGCGEVAQFAHLPAYEKYGYRVLLACDQDPDRARATADRFAIGRVARDLDEVLDDPDVSVVDLAVHPHQRLALVEPIAAAGKHILSQKPLALNMRDARAIVDICERAGVVLMVNHQARWAPGHRALHTLAERGDLGHVYSVLHVYRDFQDFEGSWFVQTPYATTLDHGVHYFDLLRHFTGRNPSVVKAGATMMPGQLAITPMIHTVVCEYGPDDALLATLHFNNVVSARASHHYEWHLDGTLGSAAATLTHLRLWGPDGECQVAELEGSWYVDAFAAAMGEMLDAVVTGRAPLTSGRDHLDSLQIAMDAIRSATTGAAVLFASAEELPGAL